MWIIKNSKDLLQTLQSQSLKFCTNIKIFNFSTLYATIPHAKLKNRIQSLIKQCFFHKNGNRRYKFLVLGYDQTFFVKNTTESKSKNTKDDSNKMLDFLIDNIFVEFGGLIFQHTVGIPKGTNCAPLLADLFLHSYEAEFIQNLLKDKKKTPRQIL